MIKGKRYDFIFEDEDETGNVVTVHTTAWALIIGRLVIEVTTEGWRVIGATVLWI